MDIRVARELVSTFPPPIAMLPNGGGRLHQLWLPNLVHVHLHPQQPHKSPASVIPLFATCQGGQHSTWVGGAVGWDNLFCFCLIRVCLFVCLLAPACFVRTWSVYSVCSRLAGWLCSRFVSACARFALFLLLLLLLPLSVSLSLCCVVPCSCVLFGFAGRFQGFVLGTFTQHRALSTAVHAEFAFLHSAGQTGLNIVL